METITPKFKIGDRISCYGTNYGRRTGVITRIMGVYHYRGKDDVLYRYTDDITGNEASSLERDLTKCRKPLTKDDFMSE